MRTPREGSGSSTPSTCSSTAPSGSGPCTQRREQRRAAGLLLALLSTWALSACSAAPVGGRETTPEHTSAHGRGSGGVQGSSDRDVDSLSAEARQLAAGPSLERLAAKLEASVEDGKALLEEQTRVIDAEVRLQKAVPDLASAEEVAERSVFSGCLDYAALFAAVLRLRGIKTKMIHGVSAEWVKRRQEGSRDKLYKGHAFLQVFLDGRWQLLDPTGGLLYPDCPIVGGLLPQGYLLQHRAPDLWSAGIRDISTLNESMDEFARTATVPADTKAHCKHEKLRPPRDKGR